MLEDDEVEKIRQCFKDELEELVVSGTDFSLRKRVSCKGSRLDTRVISCVDDLIGDLWETGDVSFLRLNQSVHAGSLMVRKLQMFNGEPETQIWKPLPDIRGRPYERRRSWSETSSNILGGLLTRDHRENNWGLT